MTASDLITSALQELGVVASGQSLSAEDGALGLARLNDFLDSLANQRLTIYNQERSVYSLVSGQQRYTIGTSGSPDFNQARPLWIDDIGLIIATDTEVPCQILTRSQWAAIINKDLESTQPVAAYYNPNAPNGELDIWPTVNNDDIDIVLYWPSSSLTSVATLQTTITVPPGWSKMLRTNLAVECAPSFGRSVSPKLQQLADDSMADIKRVNIAPQDLYFDPSLLTHATPYNILTDTP